MYGKYTYKYYYRLARKATQAETRPVPRYP